MKNDHLWSFFNIIYTFLGSIFEPCYIQNRVITNRVIKRLWCIQDDKLGYMNQRLKSKDVKLDHTKAQGSGCQARLPELQAQDSGCRVRSPESRLRIHNIKLDHLNCGSGFRMSFDHLNQRLRIQDVKLDYLNSRLRILISYCDLSFLWWLWNVSPCTSPVAYTYSRSLWSLSPFLEFWKFIWSSAPARIWGQRDAE